MSGDNFKSSIPWPEIGKTLVVREGQPAGKSEERRMIERAGGQDGIRRVDTDTHILNTRAGNPVVRAKERSDQKTAITRIRGWLAHITGAIKAALFSPYSLIVSNQNYSPPTTGYTVLPFTTTYNVPQPDNIKWGDVISFSSGGLLVNGKEMPLLGIFVGTTDTRNIPWLIPADGDDIQKYGDAITNSSVKRVFSIGRVTVHSWFGVDATLSGATYRPDKAVLCGQRIKADDHTAWLSQLEFTGESWNSFMGGWAMTTAQVAMLLTPPYLQKTDSDIAIDQPSCVPQAQSPDVGIETTTEMLPDTDICIIGVGERASPTSLFVLWPWRDIYRSGLSGERVTNYSRTTYTQTISDTTSVNGRSVLTEASNSIQFSHNIETLRVPSVVTELHPTGGANGGAAITATGANPSIDTYYWLTPSEPDGARGWDSFVRVGQALIGSPSYDLQTQSGDFSVSLGADTLVGVNFARSKESGATITAVGRSGRLSGFLANPYAYIGGSIPGTELIVSVQEIAYNLASNIGDTELLDSLIDEKINGSWVGLPFYYPYFLFGDWYTSSITTRETLDDQSLTWETRDFILYDEPNQCFVSIDSTFSGSQHYGEAADAVLNVSIRVRTPMGDVSSLIFTQSYSYLELLPEDELISSVFYIPSPKQRVMFVPAYQEQGNFKGAAYTSSTEVSGGAVPAYLFNFVLKLDMYSSIGEDNTDSDVIHFIPCNLLEMLYAYVFSSKYGVDEYDRYPVDRPLWFNQASNTLFSQQWRVNYRDGVIVDWLDTLGGDYLTETTTGLYRV